MAVGPEASGQDLRRGWGLVWTAEHILWSPPPLVLASVSAIGLLWDFVQRASPRWASASPAVIEEARSGPPGVMQVQWKQQRNEKPSGSCKVL